MRQAEKIITKLDEILSQLNEQADRPLTLDEAAAYLDISTSYLYKLTSKGEIPHFKPRGKRIYFRRSDLNEYLLQNRVKPADEIEQEAIDRVTDNS